jgi:hypothetical protein
MKLLNIIVNVISESIATDIDYGPESEFVALYCSFSQTWGSLTLPMNIYRLILIQYTQTTLIPPAYNSQ